jgi:hypothetical protein
MRTFIEPSAACWTLFVNNRNLPRQAHPSPEIPPRSRLIVRLRHSASLRMNPAYPLRVQEADENGGDAADTQTAIPTAVRLTAAISQAFVTLFLSVLLGWPSTSLADWLDQAKLTGSLNYWYRDRVRAGFDGATGLDTEKTRNLLHATGSATLLFESGWVGNRLGFDLGVHGSWDATNHGAPDHELNFWNVNNPYDQTPRDGDCPSSESPDCTVDAAAVYRAAVRFRAGDRWRGQAGYFQPAVPTALGVNWSFTPGYYRGGEAAWRLGNWEMGATLADRYKAPWYRDDYAFRSSANEKAGLLVSLGAAGTIREGMKLGLGFAALESAPRRMLHARLVHSAADIEYSGALYMVRDPDLFSSTSAQGALTLRRSSGPYTLRAEATYAHAPLRDKTRVGNFVYRITSRFGASNGNYTLWWNNRSDFNHDGELALFGSLERRFDDLGWSGGRAGLSLAAGMADSDIAGVDDLREHAFSLFASHSWRAGPFKDASLGIHATRYFNRTRAPSWSVYTNLFQDENDIKIILQLPFNLL